MDKQRALCVGAGVLAMLVMATGCGLHLPGKKPAAPAVRAPSEKSRSRRDDPRTRRAEQEKIARAKKEAAEAKRRQEAEAREELEEKLDLLERDLVTQRKLQVRLDRDLGKAQRRLDTARKEFRILEERAVALQEMIDRTTATAEGLRAEIGDEQLKKIENLEQRMAAEKRLQDKQEVIIEQRDREIADLRAALDARDDMLKRQQKSLKSAAPVSPERSRARMVQPETVMPEADSKSPVGETPRVESRPVVVQFDPFASASDLTVRGTELWQEGKVPEAEQHFATALIKDPLAVTARYWLAWCRYMQGDLIEAKEHVDKVLRKQPRHAQAMGLSGIIAWRGDDLRTASKMLARAVKYDPEDPLLRNYQGSVYLSLGDVDKALESFRKAVELGPEMAEARFNLAIALALLDPPRLDEARHHYQASLRLGGTRDPKLEKILYQ